MTNYRVESLLAARLFLSPQAVGERLFFVSNLSGRLSLYVMNAGGSVPEPLLPPHIALQNPDLLGTLYRVFPGLGKILLLLDQDGDENYQPMFIPLAGGFPEPAFGDQFAGYRVLLGPTDLQHNIAYLLAESRSEPLLITYQANLATGELRELARGEWGFYPDAANETHTQVVLVQGYGFGDHVLYLWRADQPALQLLYGQPLDARAEGEAPPLNSIGELHFVAGGQGLLFMTSLFADDYGLAYLDLAPTMAPPAGTEPTPITITGTIHHGRGEMERLRHLQGNAFLVQYNIDGCTWLYAATFDAANRTMRLTHVLCGQGELAGGVLESLTYDEPAQQLALSFATAVSPTQIYTLAGTQWQKLVRHTNERTLGIPAGLLAPGEDASFVSHDGLRVSARLYLPAGGTGHQPPYPVVYYVHGGPQSQERPDFAWFSMPLIQLLTLNGFAVFVPNVRGSSGYGLSYMKRVDHDWGGQDRLDHVHAMTEVLPQDARLDPGRAAVMGRSYGGYMTLTLATRHPELWSAAVDMFGPYNLFTFIDRLPETWKPYFHRTLGHPEKEAAFLTERSPATYIHQLQCPMLIIQGQNDPRVIERESRDVVEQLRAAGKTAEYLLFPDEGHDVLKFENKVRCYNAILAFCADHLVSVRK